MMANILKGERTFGVVLIRNGVEALGPLAVPHVIGCSARVVHVDPFPDGRMNIVAVGEDRFRTLQTDTSAPYMTGEVELFPFDNPRTLEIVKGAHDLRGQVQVYLDLIARANRSASPEDGEDANLALNQLELPEDPTHLIFMSAALLQIPAIEKQQLLEIPSVESILSAIMRLYKREISVNNSLLRDDNDTSRRSSWLN